MLWEIIVSNVRCMKIEYAVLGSNMQNGQYSPLDYLNYLVWYLTYQYLNYLQV
ncbi:hypothetical protein LDENG_00290040, partial [Lucifuga dentata]